jgi:peptidoglycan/LPS O-acetylase OafA/YrhL
MAASARDDEGCSSHPAGGAGSAQRLDRLDVARGLAALMVVFYHANAIVQTPKYHGTAPFHGLFSAGGFGVDFFFVLSGFIIFYIHRRDIGRPAALGRYASKRFLRIYPPYWVAMLLVTAAYALGTGMGTGSELEPTRWITSVLLAPHPEVPVIPVAWSLRFEVMFYAAFGLLIVRPRLGWSVFLAWQAAVAIANLAGPAPTQFVVSQLMDVRNLDFAIGIAAALIVGRTGMRRGGWSSGRWFTGLGAVALALLMAEAWAPHWRIPWNLHLLLVGLASGLTIIGLASADLSASRRPARALRLLGEASYSVYLVHYALLSILAKVMVMAQLTRWMVPEVFFVALSTLATAGGIVFHLTVEKPLLRLCHRRFKARASPAPAPAAPAVP